MSHEDLYWRLHSLSKALESSGRIDADDYPDAYATVLDAMNAMRATDEGVDVSEVEKQYGGGGHAKAAGFKVPREHVLAMA